MVQHAGISGRIPVVLNPHTQDFNEMLALFIALVAEIIGLESAE